MAGTARNLRNSGRCARRIPDVYYVPACPRKMIPYSASASAMKQDANARIKDKWKKGWEESPGYVRIVTDSRWILVNYRRRCTCCAHEMTLEALSLVFQLISTHIPLNAYPCAYL
ncbi:hypothetical protein BC834DRAFT_378555 [Gloeopeniophorella convolvens]|nr:hypothetical protein BC834DRAFT_378555 [Gloeopeniophorella convolvens]